MNLPNYLPPDKDMINTFVLFSFVVMYEYISAEVNPREMEG